MDGYVLLMGKILRNSAAANRVTEVPKSIGLLHNSLSKHVLQKSSCSKLTKVEIFRYKCKERLYNPSGEKSQPDQSKIKSSLERITTYLIEKLNIPSISVLYKPAFILCMST